MSDADDQEDPQSKLPLDPVAPQPLPPVVPPQTSTPFLINQPSQVNIQQIPPKVWDRLSSDQIVDIAKMIVSQVEKMDDHQFDLAKERTKTGASTRTLALIVGAIVSLAGLAAATYLATHENAVVGGIIAAFLATILAVIVGNRFLGD
jgi:hypothetical protein